MRAVETLAGIIIASKLLPPALSNFIMLLIELIKILGG
jgi:hypothetical protein